MYRELKPALQIFLALIFSISILNVFAEDIIPTIPTVKEGQQTQHGIATPASADGTVSAIPYSVNVAPWFEVDPIDNISYQKSGSTATKIQFNKQTGDFTFTPLADDANSDVSISFYARGKMGISENVRLVISVAKVPGAINATFGECLVEYVPAYDENAFPISAVINTNGNIFRGISFQSIPLTEGNEYEYTENTVLLSKNFFKDWDVGTYDFVFHFSGGDDLILTLDIKTKEYSPFQIIATSKRINVFMNQFECNYGETLPLPVLSSDNNYEFLGWWSIPRDEGELSKKYDANTPIYKSLGLTAKWRWLGDEQEGIFLKKLYDNSDSFEGFSKEKYEYIISLNKPQSDAIIFKNIYFERINALANIECVLSANGEIISTWDDDSSFDILSGVGINLNKLVPQKENLLKIIVTSEDQNRSATYSIRIRVDETSSAVFISEGKVYNTQIELPDGSAVTLPKNPSRQGYTFNGWYTQQNGKGNLFNDETIVMGDITLYAFWIKDLQPQKKSPNKSSSAVIRIDNPQHQLHKMLTKPYLNGYDDGTFRPDESMTWAEAMTVLAKTSADYDNSVAYISDYVSMDNYKWYYNYVAYIDKKINLFDAQKQFSPDTAITRKDFSIVLAKLLQSLPTSSASGFSDISDSNLDGYVATLSQKGYINGYPDGTFMPEKRLTRAEIVAIMNRATGIPITNEGEISFIDVTPHHWAYDYIMSAAE